MLYVAIGEQTAELPAQRLDTLQGKLLRIARDGTIPADNPFVDQAEGKVPEQFGAAAYGTRLRSLLIRGHIAYWPTMSAGNLKRSIVSKVARTTAGPWVDHGPTADPRFVPPIHFYPQASIAGGAFSGNGQGWPEPYCNRYFFADFVLGWVKFLDSDRPIEATTFAEGLTRPVDLRFAPDGSLYVYLRNAWVRDDHFEPHTGSLLKIWYED